MNDLTFDRNIVLNQLSTIEINLGKIVPARRAYFDSLIGTIVLVHTWNPITWLFPKEVKITQGLLLAIVRDIYWLYSCADYQRYEKKYEAVKYKINYIGSSSNGHIILTEKEFVEINKDIAESMNCLNMSVEEELFKHYVKAGIRLTRTMKLMME